MSARLGYCDVGKETGEDCLGIWLVKEAQSFANSESLEASATPLAGVWRQLVAENTGLAPRHLLWGSVRGPLPTPIHLRERLEALRAGASVFGCRSDSLRHHLYRFLNAASTPI